MTRRLRSPRAAALLAAAVLLLGLMQGGAQSASHPNGTDLTYTLDGEFDTGTSLNVNHNSPNNDQLQLNATTSPFPFVNIAASARGTAVRIDVNTGAVLGEYQTAPNGMGRDPSRTTVDQLGNVWVANRAEFSVSGGSSKGSVARIGLVIGGTRVDGLGNADANGDYLAPPFSYNTCVDRDSDNRIKTSRGLLDIRPWPNTGSADSDGGVTTADDECIINYTRVTGTGTRTIAVDGANDVWVGGLNDRDHEKVSGVTGLPLAGTQINFGCGGYGGLVDGAGILWSARELLRYDPVATTGFCFGNDRGDYGLGIDPNTGHIWQSSLFSVGVDGPCCRLYELDGAGTILNSYPQPFGAQGVAVDGNSHVWVAEIFGSQIAHYAPDPNVPGTHLLVGIVGGLAGVTGVAVDANGKIWASEISSSSTRGAARIDPGAGGLGCVGTGCGAGYTVGAIDLTVGLDVASFPAASPYNYSDMTGFVAIGATAPSGTWTVVQDAGTAGTAWDMINWNTEPQGSVPAGTSITVKARAAETQAGLSSQTFVAVSNGGALALTGRFIEVQATLATTSPALTPVLSDIRIKAVSVTPPAAPGRMTGGGKIGTSGVSHGFELHCDATESPNNLEVNWGKGNKFHLETLMTAACSDDPSIVPNPPKAGFDTYVGSGSGRYNGVSGYTATWTFTDAGEPGKNDYAKITITAPDSTVVLTAAGNLNGGNQQAHK